MYQNHMSLHYTKYKQGKYILLDLKAHNTFSIEFEAAIHINVSSIEPLLLYQTIPKWCCLKMQWEFAIKSRYLDMFVSGRDW